MTWVHPEAKIGKNARIEPFTAIYGDVEIGDDAHIGPNAVIMDGARIGTNCKVFPGAVISAVPQDLKYKGEYTTTHIGNNVTIRESVTINRGTSYNEKTVVGDECLVMAYVHIAHDCIIGDHCIIANSVNLAGHVELEDHVVLEGLVAVQQFTRIGQHAFVSGASLVRKNVPPYVKAAREPLSYAGINSVGLKRSGMDVKTIENIEQIYKTIYVLNTNVSTGVQQVRENFPESPEKEKVISFINNSERGIMRGAQSA